MHTEMKYRFLIHYTLSFIGGYLGLYAIISRADLFGNAQTANLLGVVRDLIGRKFFGYASACGCASHIYGCCYPYGLDPRAIFPQIFAFISIGIDIFAILLLGFFPSGMSPVVALYPCSLQCLSSGVPSRLPADITAPRSFSTNKPSPVHHSCHSVPYEKGQRTVR